MSPHQVHIVDVLAEEKYAGNQLAVITDAAGLTPADMQRIAREIKAELTEDRDTHAGAAVARSLTALPR